MPNFLKPSPSDMTATTESSKRTKIAARGVVRVRREDGIVYGGHQNEGLERPKYEKSESSIVWESKCDMERV